MAEPLSDFSNRPHLPVHDFQFLPVLLRPDGDLITAPSAHGISPSKLVLDWNRNGVQGFLALVALVALVTFFTAAFLAAAVLFAVPLFAHHGTSISYEMDKTITVTGTVTEFDFSFPHPSLFFDVKDDNGNVSDRKYKLNTPIVRRVLAPGEQPTKAVRKKKKR